jgi:hypothetical protein
MRDKIDPSICRLLGATQLARVGHVARVRHHRRESALGEEDGGRNTNDDERDDPAGDSLADDEPVDTFATLEHGDADGGTDLAVSGGKRPAHARTHDDDTGGAELDADAAAGRQLGDLGTESVKDLVTVKSETGDDTSGAQTENPVRVRTHVSLRLHFARLENDYDRGERTNRVGDVISTVRERVAARGEDLQVTHAEFSLFVELFCVRVNRIHSHVLFQNFRTLVSERGFEVVLNGVPQTRRRTEDTSRVFSRLTDNGFFYLCRARASFSLFKLHLVVEFIRSFLNVRDDRKVRDNSGTASNAKADGASLPHRRVVEFEELRPLVHDEEDVDAQRATKHDREGDGGTFVRLLRAHNKRTQRDEEDEGEAAGNHRGKEPGDDDSDDTLDVREIRRLLGPNDAIGPTGNHGHTDHTTHAGVRGGDGHFESRGNDEPDGDGEDDAEAAVHQKAGITNRRHGRARRIGDKTTIETLLVGDAFTNSLHDVATHEHGASELKDSREHDGVLDGESTRANRGGESVRDIVSTCGQQSSTIVSTFLLGHDQVHRQNCKISSEIARCNAPTYRYRTQRRRRGNHR